MRNHRELDDVGVGPFSLDLRMARELGYSDDEITAAIGALQLLARGAETTRHIRSGAQCEHCGARKPTHTFGACGACGDQPV